MHAVPDSHCRPLKTVLGSICQACHLRPAQPILSSKDCSKRIMLDVSLQLTPLQPNALPSCRVRALRIFQVRT